MAYPNIHPMIPTLHPNYNDSTPYLLCELREVKRQLMDQIAVLSQRIEMMEQWCLADQLASSDGK